MIPKVEQEVMKLTDCTADQSSYIGLFRMTHNANGRPLRLYTFTEIFWVFLRLGLFSFGGPVAHFGYFHREFVNKRRWVNEQTYADLVALCQFLPGPSSSQVAYSIGALRGGMIGGLLAQLGFTLPSVLLMLAAAYGLQHFNGWQESGWVHGLKIVALAVVAQAVWQMGLRFCTDLRRLALAVLAAALILLWHDWWLQIAVIALGALAGWQWLAVNVSKEQHELQVHVWGRKLALFCLLLFAAGFFVLPLMAKIGGNGWLDLFGVFYRVGSLVFGGGHVVLPLLYAEVVPRGWLQQDAFLAGYGMAQALPGPLFSFAAYLGAAKDGAPNGWLAGLCALTGLLAPSLLVVGGVLPFWQRIRYYSSVRKASAGANAAVVGILFAVFCRPMWGSTVTSPLALGLFILAFAALQFGKIPSWLLVILGVLVGWWL